MPDNRTLAVGAQRPCSVPEHEDALGLKVLLGLHDVLSEVLSIVGDFGPHVVDHEGLREVVLVVAERHGLEMQGHHGSALNVAKFIATLSGVHVDVEELGHGGSVLREVGVSETLLPLLVVVNHVIGLGAEKLVELLVFENSVEDGDLVDAGLGSLIANAGSSDHGESSEMDLPDGGLSEHHERESSPGKEAAGPCIVATVETGGSSEKVVSCAHAPFVVVVSEDVVVVLEGLGVAVGLVVFSTAGGVDVGCVACTCYRLHCWA
jgi:hypothetical protein